MPEITLPSKISMFGAHYYTKKLCLFIALAGCINFANAQNNSLVLDGVDDYVDCGNDPLVAATNIKTMECWVKFSTIPFQCELVSKSTLGEGIELLVFNDNLSFYCMRDGGNFSYINYFIPGNIQSNIWYHIAASWDGTKESMRLYVNGVSVGALFHTGDVSTGVTDPAATTLKIGSWSYVPFDRYFPGAIDEVRIWDTERTATEIKNGMYGTVATNTPGLTAYYNMNEGTGTVAANSTANSGLNGTLTSGPLWASSPVQAGNNSVLFDGVDDHALIPNIAAYDFASGTIECRIKPASLSVDNDCFIASRGVGGIRYSFHVNNTGIVFDNGVSTQTVNVALTAGTSYLISLVTNGTNIDAYVDGVLQGSFTQTFGAVTGQPILLASPDPSNLNGENFEGSIDEVRLWNTERTATEILNAGGNLAGNETGLVALFNFNQGISEGDNSGLRVIVDGTSVTNNGTLFNLALSGTSSNYVAELVVLPVRLTSFGLTKNGRNVVVKWQTAQEQNSLKFDIERSFDGISFSRIGSVAAAGNSSTPKNYAYTDYEPANGKNFYRLKQVDLDGKSAYTQIKTISISANDKLSWTLTADKSVIVSLLKGNNEKYQLVDIMGRSIQKGNLSGGRIQFSNLRSGRYTLMIENADRMMIGFIVP